VRGFFCSQPQPLASRRWLVILEIFISLLKWGYDPKLISPDVVHYADVGRACSDTSGRMRTSPSSIRRCPSCCLSSPRPRHARNVPPLVCGRDGRDRRDHCRRHGAAAARIWAGLERPLAAVTALAIAVVAMGAIAIQVFDGAVALVCRPGCVVTRVSSLDAGGARDRLGFSLKLMQSSCCRSC